MTRRPNNLDLAGKKMLLPQRGALNYHRPFWLPASNFYVLATAIAAAVFFLIWGILHEGEEEMPWIPAGILASLIVVGAVVLREIVLKSARRKLLLTQERLDYNLKNVYRQMPNLRNDNKLTLEKNATIIKQILRKSEAANVLVKLPEAHWEVFELCNEYLHLNQRELETIRAGSPRLPVLRDSRRKVQELHKSHLLAWASIESRTLTQEAKSRVTTPEKLETAQKSLLVLDSALQFYPGEVQLIESANVITEFIATIKISDWFEQAERSAFKKNYNRAINHYRDLLFFLARENTRIPEYEAIVEKINLEIEKLRKLLTEKKESQKRISPKPNQLKHNEND